MHYKSNVIQSQRLTYHLVCEHDCYEIVANISKDVLINIGSYPWPYTEKDAEQFIRDCKRAQDRHQRYDYIVRDLKERFIGIISLHLMPEKNSDDPGMIGYWIASSKRRQGYGLEAIDTIIKLAKSFKLSVVWARIRYDNFASIALIHKAGFTFQKESEGTYDNKRLTARIYALSLEEDYDYQNSLKINWERGADFIGLDISSIQNLIQPFTKQQVSTHTLLTTGCANTNYLLEFDGGNQVILRIYTRDQHAFCREQQIQNLVNHHIPMARILFVDNSLKHINHSFALIEYKAGANMRDVILTGNKNDIVACAFAAGQLCAYLREIKLPHAGSFQTDGLIKLFTQDEAYHDFATAILNKNSVIETIGLSLCKQIKQWLDRHQVHFINQGEASLTHADFDPANMLIKKEGGNIQISALLDWEFSFSGSYLIDVGQFLRYSHHFPADYKTNFIAGFSSTGQQLSKDWEVQAKALDLLSLLTLIGSNSKDERPVLIKDVIGLIERTIYLY